MSESNDLIYDYTPPVTQLLTLGDVRGQPHRDYLALGLNAVHIPDLIRMAQDDDLHWADSDSAEVWAPIHAWRALGQLRAVEAIEPLIAHLPRIDDDEDDWAMEEIPHALAGIGQAAVPALALFLADSRNGLWARITAASSLGKPGCRRRKFRPKNDRKCSLRLRLADNSKPKPRPKPNASKPNRAAKDSAKRRNSVLMV
jgi:hypothetical protein